MISGTLSNSIRMKRYGIFCQVCPIENNRLAQPILQVVPISEEKNTIKK